VTGSVGDRAHLSIGEVLSLLREEFADITISKIRFLESQGLVDPERTPSGYRKFYEDDVERLRWILRQQREHFLPLKVIKGRLSEAGSDGELESPETSGDNVDGGERVPDDEANAALPAPPGPQLTAATSETNAAAAHEQPRGRTPSAPAGPGRGVVGAEPATVSAPAVARSTPGAAPDPADPSQLAPETSPPGAARPDAGGATRGAQPLRVSTRTSPPRPTPASDAGATGTVPPRPGGEGAGTVNMTIDELAGATGLDPGAVRELERFGLVAGRDLGGTTYFDAEALAVAQMAAGFARHGVEARHLRMYKNAAERETGLFEQVVMPLFKQRNPQARQQAMGTLEELSRLGAELRGALLQAALRDAF
jgi:DNA-binding transcriptional MerR regulator